MQRTILSAMLGVLLVAGCVVEESGGFDVGARVRTVSNQNRLSVNRLSMNRLSLNRLSVNRLSVNRLALNRLALNRAGSDALETTEQGRDLLNYVAKCALRDGDILVAEVDGATYEFPGLLGVAPEWENAPLTPALQRWVSACLLAHVNAFDTSVPISMRAPGKLESDLDERVEFPVYEATFLGNVFNVEQDMYACTGDMPEVASALSTSRVLRACSDPAGGSDASACQFTTLGRCRDVCSDKNATMGWSGCGAGGTSYSEAVSVFLRSTVPADANMYCAPGARCDFSSAEPAGSVMCTDADRCAAALSDSGVYKVDCAGAGRCDAACASDMLCEIDCAGSDRCRPQCSDGSDCEMDCLAAGRCDEVRCTWGSSCLLHCRDADQCAFKKCDGEVRQCPGNILVCNRACPAP
jgi:hypothetical protein